MAENKSNTDAAPPEARGSIKDVAVNWLRDMGPEVTLGIGAIIGSIATGAVCTLAIIVALQ